MAANLTSVAIATRKSVRYGLFFLIFFMIGRSVFFFGIRTYNQMFPKKAPPPTVGFGKLTSIPFPKEVEKRPEFNISLETPTGGFPTFPTQMLVFFMPKPSIGLYSTDLAKEKARAVGFTTEPTEISQTVYRFTRSNGNSFLEMNVVTNVFSMGFNLASDASPLNFNAPQPSTAKLHVEDFLRSMQLLPTDLTGEVGYQLLKVEEQNLTKALALSDADFVKVNLFRTPITMTYQTKGYKFNTVTKLPDESTVWFIVSGDATREKRFIAGEFRYYPIDMEKPNTYPIKTPTQAFEELKQGKAYIANLGLKKDGKITVRRIDLAYYDPDVPTQFFQPVYVFKGDGDFIAYVPAVTADYYGE
jgi:hypothetical protein